MALQFRPITGGYYNINDTPAAGEKVTFELTLNDFTLDGNVQKKVREITLDDDGLIPSGETLWCNGDGFNSTQIKETCPDGSVYYWTLDYGDGSSIDVSTARATGKDVPDRITTQALIEQVVSGNYQAINAAAGGVLSGNYPNPGFAVDMAEQSEVDVALALKAALASPAFTGTPTAPTAVSTTNSTQIATTAFVKTLVAELIDSAPGTLDSLNELAAALGDNPNFATDTANSLGLKLSKASNLSDLADIAVAKTNLGLASVATSGAYADLSGTPQEVPDPTGHSGKFLTNDGVNYSWAAVSGGGGVDIGDTIGNSPVSNGLLYTDSSGNLQNDAQLTFDSSTDVLYAERFNVNCTYYEPYGVRIYGQDATSAKYALFVENSAGSDIAYFRNDLNTWMKQLTINSIPVSTYQARVVGQGNTSATYSMVMQNSDFDVIFRAQDDGLITFTEHAVFGNTGWANARIRVQGHDQTSSKYGILVEDSALNDCFYVRNDRRVWAYDLIVSNNVGFYNTTPIPQPTTGVSAATFAANTSGISDDTATWGGYTAGQVVQALQNFGLLA